MSTAGNAASAPSGRVIKAKVRPPFSGGWVARPRPEALLAEALESRRVVVVSATAGSGKTTLVAAVTAGSKRPVAWLTLDWTDTAPGRLLTYLEAALAVVVPRADGVARDALAARIPHPEAAGLLAEAVAGEHVVLVIDELERLGEDPDAWAVIEALLRHAPADMRFVLSSRRPVPASVLPRNPGEVIRLGDDALALTIEEAAEVLHRLDRPPVDPAAVVQATGGWVTGVLFEAWRLADRGLGDGTEDELYGYLSAHILRDLPAEDREFLIASSVLDKVTAERAGALGLPDPAARLASLRAAHMPATWSDGGRALHCHPRFREYLQTQLESWPAARLRALHVAHGRLLASEGHHEEATEELLRAGATAEALEPAAIAIFALIDRLDFGPARRWLDALAGVEPDGMSPFVVARLTLAIATDDHRLGEELADRLAARGKLEEVAASSSAVSWMLSLCYVMAARYDDMLTTLALAPHDADYEAVQTLMSVFMTGPPPPLPELIGGPLDSVLPPTLYGYGHLARVIELAEGDGWTRAFSQPWLIAALADAGRVQEAVDMYEAVRARGLTNASLDAWVGPRALTDAGRRDEALEAIGRGRRLAREGPFPIYGLAAGIGEARLRLRLDRDAAAALHALEPVDRNPITHRIGYLSAWLDCWYGFALLLAGRDAEAVERLRRTVALMRRMHMMLELPTAAVYLAEAEWRMGNDAAADAAADLALEAAAVQGFNHMLLMALHDVPGVLPRRLDAEPAADSPWHELGRALRALRAQGVAVPAPARAALQLREFGRVLILVEGTEVRLRLAKSYELLAYLLTRPHHHAERGELLDALFDARADDSARAYLRQAINKLRPALPPDALIADRAGITLSDQLAGASESVQLQRALAHAARLRGPERLHATLTALEPIDHGPYLPGIHSHWVEERRQHLRELATDARYDAAELALSAGHYDTVERLTNAILDAEPYHEAAWRLAMRLASARGDDQGVLRCYQRCDELLTEVGAAPSPTTRQLVDQLRR